MTDPITNFFDAWEITDNTTRLKLISSAVSEDIHYADPKTSEPVTGLNALNDYVGMFSASAPGWSAKVIKRDTTADVTRVTVAFSGQGPDGNEMTQHGQYFVEKNGDLISRMVGFVGTGN